ncbi:unnamed protein product [Clonostachys rosea]|uniref:Uncharacterized protein n=1 Tax=Bionectria ochroleuca TaxID=29856 RepID=A0ABY6U6L6_BIOOC|nr:unnamed protein product [Clonostachys rosea]
MAQVVSRGSSVAGTPPVGTAHDPHTAPASYTHYQSAHSSIENQQEIQSRQSLSDQDLHRIQEHLLNRPCPLSYFPSRVVTFPPAPPRPASLSPEPLDDTLVSDLVPVASATAASSPREAAHLLIPAPPPASSTASMSISSTKHRVGMPPVRPLPLKNSYDMSGICSPDVLDELYHEVADILAGHNIRRPEFKEPTDPWDDGSDSSICLVYRSIPDVPGSDRLTLLITAHWTDSSAEGWELAVQDIKPLVADHLSRPDVDVEMIATYLTTPRQIGPVGHYPLVEDNWDAISYEIEEALQSHAASRDTMTAIAIFRMGYREKIEDNPITVYVSVSHECPEASWPPIIEDINKILEPFSLELFFEHNYWKLNAFELVPPRSAKRFQDEFVHRPYQERPDLGADIGAARYLEYEGRNRSPLMGTLGCYVDVRTKKGERKTMALTNYHVCRPCVPGYTLERKGDAYVDSGYYAEGDYENDLGDGHEVKSGKPPTGSILRGLDRSGIVTSKHRRYLLPMEHPSRVRHNIRVAESQAAFESHPNDERMRFEVERDLQTFKRAFDQQANILGHVWAASGYDHRSSNEPVTFLDWALIEVVPNRQGKNVLPDDSIWKASLAPRSCRPDYKGMDHLKMYRDDTTLSTLKDGTRVFKYGATTGPTIGLYSGLKTRNGIPMVNGNPSRKDRVQITKSTEAHVVQRNGNHQFSAPGDSGAMVYDQEGHALGLVFSKLCPSVDQKGDYLTWVIPIDQIFEDIKKTCGITDIQISPVVGSLPN